LIQSESIQLSCNQLQNKSTELFKYSFDKCTGILYKFYYGEILLDEIFTTWDIALANNLIPKNVKGFILDYRNATFKLKRLEYQCIAKYYKMHLDVFGNKRIAVITATPSDTVIPILVKTLDEGYSSKPFSTVEAAIDWVLR